MDENIKAYDRVKYNKDYYEQHKEQLKERALKKILCPHCDKEYSQANWHKHIKTEKHITKEKLSESEDKSNILEQIKELQERLKMDKK
jgi:alkyl hydroperoxide reductase subunit AhpC